MTDCRPLRRAGDADAVFAEGFTTSERPARAGAGHGLGLALARQLARRRGGDVRVLDPGSPGGPGAVFMATLPGNRRRPTRCHDEAPRH